MTTTDKDWLGEILDKLDLYKLTPKEAKAAILKEIDRILGETYPVDTDDGFKKYHNELVAEQRQRAGLSKKEESA
jgi:hypothetical protein